MPEVTHPGEGAADPDFIVVGHLSKPHGTKGEIYVWPLTDRGGTTFVAGAKLRVSDREGKVPDEAFPLLRIRGVRPYRRGYLLFFDDVRDRDAADLLRDRYLLRPFDEAEPLEEDELFYHQLLGMTVHTSDGTEVGRIREVYNVKPADLLDVVGPERAHLIPFTREIVTGWDLEEGRLLIDPPSGLLDL